MKIITSRDFLIIEIFSSSTHIRRKSIIVVMNLYRGLKGHAMNIDDIASNFFTHVRSCVEAIKERSTGQKELRMTVPSKIQFVIIRDTLVICR